MRVVDRVVLVTGAGGAIGAEICRHLLEEGAMVAATDLRADPLDELSEKLHTGTAADRLSTTALDSTDDDAVRRWVAAATARWGPVDGLVNVAGLFQIEPFADTTRADWERMIIANLYTAMTTCRATLPAMADRGRGAVVNFASTAGEYGSIRPSAAYAAAKGGVIAFSKSLAREFSPAGVRVNCVSPGPIDTAMFQAGGHADRGEAASRTLVGRMGRPADLAHAVTYLVSDDSSFVTGEVLRVNGGSLI